MVDVDIDTGAFLAGVTAALGQLRRETVKQTQRTGERTASRARQIAPKRTGTLANSIDFVEKEDGGELRVTVPYAAYVEFGTSDTPAQPFARPALAEAPRFHGR